MSDRERETEKRSSVSRGPPFLFEQKCNQTPLHLLLLTLAPAAQLHAHALVHELGQVDRVLAARHIANGEEREQRR